MKNFHQWLETRFIDRYHQLYGDDKLVSGKSYEYYFNMLKQQAKKQGRELTPDELAALEKHKQNDREVQIKKAKQGLPYTDK